MGVLRIEVRSKNPHLIWGEEDGGVDDDDGGGDEDDAGDDGVVGDGGALLVRILKEPWKTSALGSHLCVSHLTSSS